MKPKIENVWISLETKGFITPAESIDQNTDIIVTLSTGERYAATFFTYQNIVTLTSEKRLSGEWLGGRYLWATDMLLIEKIDRLLIHQVIEDLINDGSWPAAFRLLAQ
jgi:hypothetical protein